MRNWYKGLVLQVQCDKCKIWIHAECDKISSKHLEVHSIADFLHFCCPVLLLLYLIFIHYLTFSLKLKNWVFITWNNSKFINSNDGIRRDFSFLSLLISSIVRLTYTSSAITAQTWVAKSSKYLRKSNLQYSFLYLSNVTLHLIFQRKRGFIQKLWTYHKYHTDCIQYQGSPNRISLQCTGLWNIPRNH